jgi:peptidoglycan/xylan/chitin deacetylase (PgdA/CDA1 family)
MLRFVRRKKKGVKAPILAYHWFEVPEEREKSPARRFGISEALFEAELLYLKGRGFESVSLESVRSALLGEGKLPKRAVVLTFDDATQDFKHKAFPLLQKHGFGATVFAVTAHVGGENVWDQASGEPVRKCLTWDEILELGKAGIQFGSHSHTHRNLTMLSNEALWKELDVSKRILEEKLGKNPVFFAYPYGAFNERVKQAVREAGYAGSCALSLVLSDCISSDLYSLRRVLVKSGESFFRFRLRFRLGKLPHRN